MNNLPDITKPLQLLKLSDRLQKEISGDSVIAWTIREGLNENKPLEVIAYIKQQSHDNMGIMRDVIGDDLLTEILNY